MEAILSIAIGLGLSAACGFRVFVPMLAMSVAARADQLVLAESFAFLNTDLALIGLSIATICEIGTYYIPWLDNLIDSIATPSAIIAGVFASGAMQTDMSPFLHWSVAAIGGGGLAATVQVGTAATRQVSAITTGGLGNPVVSTAELFGSAVMAIMAIVVPILALAVITVFFFFAIKKIRDRRNLKRTKAAV